MFEQKTKDPVSPKPQHERSLACLVGLVFFRRLKQASRCRILLPRQPKSVDEYGNSRTRQIFSESIVKLVRNNPNEACELSLPSTQVEQGTWTRTRNFEFIKTHCCLRFTVFLWDGIRYRYLSVGCRCCRLTLPMINQSVPVPLGRNVPAFQPILHFWHRWPCRIKEPSGRERMRWSRSPDEWLRKQWLH